MTDDTARLYVSIDRSGLTPRYIASPHMHPGAREWIPRDAVRVKPLEWSREAPYHVARVIGGHYAIEVWQGGVDLIGTFVNRRFSSFEAAKAAAQADFEARIMSALVALEEGE